MSCKGQNSFATAWDCYITKRKLGFTLLRHTTANLDLQYVALLQQYVALLQQ
jgi:hypothetical protein